MRRATPIFVLGMQRSGTTWVSNMLEGSGVVAAVTAEEHHGVHESVFFSHFAHGFEPFQDANARRRFREAFLKSDYFLLTDLLPDVVDEALLNALDYADVFDAVMQTLAARDGKTHWLEKSPHHTMLAEELADRFPDALFVCVVRESRSLIASRLAAYGREPSRNLRRVVDILRGALVNSLYLRRLQRFAEGCDRAMLLRYETFRRDQSRGRGQLVQFLRLSVPADNLVSTFAPNTSHIRADTQLLSSFDTLLIRVGDAFGRLLPLSLLSLIERKRRKSRGLAWPDWVWQRTGYRP